MKLELYDDYESGAWSMILYGEAGIGKTTFASTSPGCVIVNLEDGLKGVPLKANGAVATQHIQSFDDALEAMTLASRIDGVQTIVVDSITRLEDLAVAKVCFGEKKATLADFKYGRGYSLVKALGDLFIEKLITLRNKGFNVIMIAHNKVEDVDDPEAGEHQRHNFLLRKEWHHRFGANADHVFYMHRPKIVDDETNKAVLTRKTVIQTTQTGGAFAKTRGVRPTIIEVVNGENDRQIWTKL